MPTFIAAPTLVEAAGDPPKQIEEYIGKVNSGSDAVSVAKMRSPAGWIEPRQKPKFDEYTIVLNGMVRVQSDTGTIDVPAGSAIIAHRGEWVQYSSPNPGGAEYIAVCLPAFSPETVYREV